MISGIIGLHIWKRLYKTLPIFLILSGAVLSLFSILLEGGWLKAHLAVHFQLQFWVMVAIGSILLAFQKRWKILAVSTLWLVVVYVIVLHPISLFSMKRPDDVDLFYINAHYLNKHPEQIAEVVNELSPDTVVLIESSPEVVASMDDRRNDQVVNHRAYASSCTIYTEGHRGAEVANLTHLPICIVRYEDYDLLAVHAHRPLGKENLQENLEFFDVIRGYIDEYELSGRPFILVGDFNSSNYSKLFRDRFGEYVEVNRYTWFTGTPLTLPIDHVISNMDVTIAQRRIKGSDHSALLVDFNEY